MKMTKEEREHAEKAAEALHAFDDGKQLQFRPLTGGDWKDADNEHIFFDFFNYEYRAKPETVEEKLCKE